MASKIIINKGLDIRIDGRPIEKLTKIPTAGVIEICPDHFHGIIPKMLVKGGEAVKAGSPLFFNKQVPAMNFVSPVSGTVREVVRGERRKVMSIVIETGGPEYLHFDVSEQSSPDAIKALLLQSGLWAFIKQRPFDVIANPALTPRAVFISGFDSAPLAPDYEFTMKGRMSDFQKGVDVLAKITSNIHLGLKAANSIFAQVKGVQTTVYQGPHPAGNVGVQINRTAPVNKGEVVWTIAPHDVAVIGHFFDQGVVDMTKIIALTGPEVANPHYFETVSCNSIAEIVKGRLKNVPYPLRFISGNVLTGTKIAADGCLTPYALQISVIDEGRETHELFGWAMPRLDKFSFSNLFFAKLFPNKKFKYDARILGGPRAIFMSGEWERVFPMDIFPEQLIKTMLARNIDRMEKLGAYEVAPEDFALCEFVDTSKMPLQSIVREALDMLRAEVE